VREIIQLLVQAAKRKEIEEKKGEATIEFRKEFGVTPSGIEVKRDSVIAYYEVDADELINQATEEEAEILKDFEDFITGKYQQWDEIICEVHVPSPEWKEGVMRYETFEGRLTYIIYISENARIIITFAKVH